MDTHPLRHIWRKMIARCHNPDSDAFGYYGARGIKVCERWLKSFNNFVADVGARPSLKHTLDRYPNNDGYYKPSNVRWATHDQQMANTRRNRIVVVHSERMHVAEAARRFGIKAYVISFRLESGWNDHDAVLIPVEKRISLTEEQRAKIRSTTGKSQDEIAKHFGVCQKTISNILKEMR